MWIPGWAADCVAVNSVDEEMPALIAVIVAVPAVWVCVNPRSGVGATSCADEFQVALAVRFWLVPSVKLPVAVNCCEAPAETVGFNGDIARETSWAGPTRATVVPVIPAEMAVSEEEPIAFVVAKPILEMVSTFGLDDFHVAIGVKSCVVPSVNVPVAVNC